MTDRACIFCGVQNTLLVEIFPDGKVDEKLPFCEFCIEAGACKVQFGLQKKLDSRAVMQSLCRVGHLLARQLEDVKRELEILRHERDAS